MIPTLTIEEQIDQLQAQIANLQKQRELANIAADPIKYIADMLHGMECKWNHTDGCGWFYEKDESYYKHNSTKGRYYQQAKKLVAGLERLDCDTDTIIEILKEIQNCRNP